MTMPNTTTPHVSRQPISLSSMDLYCDEKRPSPPSYASHDCECTNGPHHECHKSRRRQFLVIVSLIFSITAIGIILISCIHDLATLGVFGGDDGVLGLAKRALGARDTSGTDSGSSFVNNKLYLIVVLVGLFLVLVFAIMLSAWCCRGMFTLRLLLEF
ncbi:hypothetical protein PILCRDRAFT_758934 [Piloderma croceum F 1598]|uniref:Transmembrane protein n=1 Tax=Piloderma croceum (strain F 1598) TaxID=765440 RepID=A0A0C3EEZ2_PILCF|nr:hypothetical protein PILCRDRAFT_758934 [Piloderma croceum F 1598]